MTSGSETEVILDYDRVDSDFSNILQNKTQQHRTSLWGWGVLLTDINGSFMWDVITYINGGLTNRVTSLRPRDAYMRQ